jgi:hypothetical protein
MTKAVGVNQHLINIQLVTDPVIMPAKKEHGCDSGSESLDKHEPRDIDFSRQQDK